ncbi:MAG: type I DNA topoisomerase [Firmicutes bacterium]|nr:type I DNA topoisomerase [Bacillota bacterium]
MKLVIIEGVGKKDTIKKYLGSGFDVVATGGHIRDLPKNRMAVDEQNNFEPEYIIPTDKKENVKKLKERAKGAEIIYLASDPDREGEAIAWHVAHILGIDPNTNCRVAFNQIEKKAITSALSNPRPIDINLVEAQQARRVLDRIVGYKLSPLVSKKVKPKLSAGRVQSVTLLLVVEREREILNFKPEEYWNIIANLSQRGVKFNAALMYGLDGKRIKVKTAEQAALIKAATIGAKFVVKSVTEKVTKAHAPAPFTTSTMQQDALNKAGLSLKRAAMAAQGLYEGISLGEQGKTALVTYIRTDSVRVAPDAQKDAKEYIVKRFGEQYAPENFNIYKSKKSAQDAHEAIRPINLENTPDLVKPYLTPDQQKLYTLIYNRFLASQMSDATYNTLAVEIDANCYGFKVNGKTPIFLGWTAAYEQYKDKDEKKEDEEDEGDDKLPPLAVGDNPVCSDIKTEQKFTKPPARYTEASLVKAMEEKGIGRPATYNPIIANLFARFYIEREGKQIKPTELGCTVVDMLVKYFPNIMEVTFTADMEESLDDIAEGTKEWHKIIKDFYTPFIKDVLAAANDGQTMRIADEVSDVACDKCGALMVFKMGRFGKFLACPNYPDCKNIKSADKPICDCPKCTVGKVNKRKSKKGMIFYGCDKYPNCDFVSWDEPTGEKCAKCNSHMVIKRNKDGDKILCSNKECV